MVFLIKTWVQKVLQVPELQVLPVPQSLFWVQEVWARVEQVPELQVLPVPQSLFWVQLV